MGQHGRRFRTSGRETGPDKGSGTHSDIPSGQLSPVEYVGEDEEGKRAEVGGWGGVGVGWTGERVLCLQVNLWGLCAGMRMRSAERGLGFTFYWIEGSALSSDMILLKCNYCDK